MSQMDISIIVAMTPDRGIGAANGLPWHVSADLKRFKLLTSGHAVLMGRKTFDSLGKPLPNRHNMVISRKAGVPQPGVEWWTSIHDAVNAAQMAGETELFICGGGEIYRACLPLATRIYMTMIRVPIQATVDTWFPAFNAGDWQLVGEEHLPECDFLDYVRVAGHGR
ncbi:MAG: dihydrofolate reductase [Phycisphaerae bacterium]